MARNLKEIKSGITLPFMANETLATEYGFAVGSDFDAEFSVVSFENIVFNIIAFVVFLLEQIFDTHKKEVNDIIELEMPHRASWYRTKALAFQYGFNLIQDTDKYDNTGFADEQIANSKVIKYAAVTKLGGQILIKIATETGGVLTPIERAVKDAFDFYIEEIADCGVKYIVVNHLPDLLVLGIEIYRNPLLIDETGMKLGPTGGYYPVQDAIKEYMKELPFNGELVLAHLVDKLQQVEGVRIPHIYNATSQSIDINTGLYLPAEYIDVKTVPVAGYFDFGSINEITGEFESGSFKNINYVV